MHIARIVTATAMSHCADELQGLKSRRTAQASVDAFATLNEMVGTPAKALPPAPWQKVLGVMLDVSTDLAVAVPAPARVANWVQVLQSSFTETPSVLLT